MVIALVVFSVLTAIGIGIWALVVSAHVDRKRRARAMALMMSALDGADGETRNRLCTMLSAFTVHSSQSVADAHSLVCVLKSEV